MSFPLPDDELRTDFLRWLESRPSHWDRFKADAFRICEQGCPKAGEYANDMLQQLWECWRDAYEAGSGL